MSGVVEAESSDLKSDCSEVVAARRDRHFEKDLFCPICMETMRDAFLSSCGHSFCYKCITTHLNIKNSCPCCGIFLTNSQLYPNFLLNKIMKKVSAYQLAERVSPAELFRLALKQGADISTKEIDRLLDILGDRKRKAEREESKMNMEMLLDFLYMSRQRKEKELNETRGALEWLKEDISAIKLRRMELFDQYKRPRDKQHSRNVGPQVTRRSSSGKSKFRKLNPSFNASAVLAKKRVSSQFEDLQHCYIEKRSDSDDNGNALEDFEAVLTSFTNFSQLKVISVVRHADLLHSSNIVSSIEFDRDEEFFATAGVSRRIEVFDYSSIVDNWADIHHPVAGISCRSKLSCLSWNKRVKNHLASSDYEGIVMLWDVNRAQSIMEYEEHEKRAWSVDFSTTEPSMLISGSDDGKVKVWCTNKESSALTIDMKANICCVKYNPSSTHYIAVGSADHDIHYYDLRNVSSAVRIMKGHEKAVSYVKFLSSTEIASASTDSTLRLWNINNSNSVRTLTGHSNEKNFVGLSVSNEFIACGSETNEVFVYNKAMSKAVGSHRFERSEGREESENSFISTVCWSDNKGLLCANSQGIIKLLQLTSS